MFRDKFNQVLKIAETSIITILMVTLLVVLCYALLLLLAGVYQRLIVDNLFTEYAQNPEIIHSGLYRAFGNMLTILLGLELIHTIKIYFADNQLRIESIIVILIIALSRHLILLDLHHTDPLLLIALGILLGVLVAAYILISRLLGSASGH